MWRDAYREIIESMFLQADSFEVLLLGIKSAEVESLSFFLSRDCCWVAELRKAVISLTVVLY